MEARLPVELDILRGIDQVEAEDPAPDRRRQEPGEGRAKITRGRSPGAHRRSGQREAQHRVGVGGEMLGQRIAQDEEAGDGTEREAEEV
jgi:hypothetical protein